MRATRTFSTLSLVAAALCANSAQAGGALDVPLTEISQLLSAPVASSCIPSVAPAQPATAGPDLWRKLMSQASSETFDWLASKLGSREAAVELRRNLLSLRPSEIAKDAPLIEILKKDPEALLGADIEQMLAFSRRPLVPKDLTPPSPEVRRRAALIESTKESLQYELRTASGANKEARLKAQELSKQIDALVDRKLLDVMRVHELFLHLDRKTLKFDPQTANPAHASNMDTLSALLSATGNHFDPEAAAKLINHSTDASRTRAHRFYTELSRGQAEQGTDLEQSVEAAIARAGISDSREVRLLRDTVGEPKPKPKKPSEPLRMAERRSDPHLKNRDDFILISPEAEAAMNRAIVSAYNKVSAATAAAASSAASFAAKEIKSPLIPLATAGAVLGSASSVGNPDASQPPSEPKKVAPAPEPPTAQQRIAQMLSRIEKGDWPFLDSSLSTDAEAARAHKITTLGLIGGELLHGLRENKAEHSTIQRWIDQVMALSDSSGKSTDAYLTSLMRRMFVTHPSGFFNDMKSTVNFDKELASFLSVICDSPTATYELQIRLRDLQNKPELRASHADLKRTAEIVDSMLKDR